MGNLRVAGVCATPVGPPLYVIGSDGITMEQAGTDAATGTALDKLAHKCRGLGAGAEVSLRKRAFSDWGRGRKKAGPVVRDHAGDNLVLALPGQQSLQREHHKVFKRWPTSVARTKVFNDEGERLFACDEEVFKRAPHPRELVQLAFIGKL